MAEGCCFVGAPVDGTASPQRADTSVGPYRGSKGVLYFGGVASIRFVQRAGVLRTADRPRPYKTSMVAL